MSIAFAMNYSNLYEIDITPNGAARTFVRVGEGINSVEWEGNEEVAQDPYYNGDGFTSSDITGGQLVGTFEGHRYYGDPAQDYIASLLLAYGEDRKTNFRWTAPNGNVIEGGVTVANIAPQSGDPNAKSDFGFEIHFNGLPTFTPGDASTFPDTITGTAASVAVGASAKIAVTVTPKGAADSVVFSSDDRTVATVDSDGTVHGVKAGVANVVVKSCVRPTVTGVVKVTVTTSK